MNFWKDKKLLNDSQKKILEIRSQALNLESRDDLIERYLVALETKLQIKIDRNKSSNFYILAGMMVDMGVDAYNLLNLINLEMLNFFDENKFDGYLGSDYMGCRQALMQLGLFIDVKFFNDFTGDDLGKVQTILLPNPNVNLNDSVTQNLIAEAMHGIFPVGTVNYNAEVAINVKITAHTGQELTYSFFEASFELLGLWVEYTVDYETYDLSLDYEERITSEINNIYILNYGFIGKDFILNDFLGLVRDVKGLRTLKFYKINVLEEAELKGEEIAANIEIDKLKVFKFSNIKVVGV